MKYLVQFVAIAAATLILLFFTLRFAFSDFIWQEESGVSKSNPWRPFARLAFGAVAVPMIVFFMGWISKALYRNRD